MSKSELYFEFLAEEGYRPHRDGEGDITFRKEGKLYVLFAGEDDPQLFRLGALYIWPIESEEERVQALQAASVVTGRMKVTKVYVMDDNVHATIELLYSRPEEFKPLFDRLMGLLDAGVQDFAAQMRAFTPAATA